MESSVPESKPLEVQEKPIGYRDVLKQKEYLKFIAANLINRFGDSVDAIAMTWVVYAITNSASWSAIVYALNRIPSIIIQPLAGPIVEKASKKSVIIFTDIIRGCLVGIFALLYMLNILQPWMIALVTLLISTAEAFCSPASISFVMQIIDMKYYTYASSLNSTLCTVVELAGLGAAGIIITNFGTSTAIAVDAATFIFSALIICIIKYQIITPQNTNKYSNDELDSVSQTSSSKNLLMNYLHTLRDGFIYVKNKNVIRNFCIMAIILNATFVPFSALQSPLVCEVLKQDTSLLSTLGIAISLGMALGAAFYPYISKRISSLCLVCSSGIAIGFSYIGMISGSIFPQNTVAVYSISFISCLLLGIGASVVSSVLSVKFVKVVSQDYLARVGSIFNAMGSSAIPAVSFIISVIVAFVSTRVIFLASGFLCVIIFICIGLKKLQFE